MSTIYRVSQPPEVHEKPPEYIQDWLDHLVREREQTIARLRSLDVILVKYGRIKTETLERRNR